MSAPDYELQAAIERALRGSSAMKGLAGDPVRLYSDSVPEKAPYPYMTIGEGDMRDHSAGNGYEAVDVSLDVHIWASKIVDAKRIAGAIRALLHGTVPVLETCKCLVLRCNGSRGTMRDQDGVTKHCVVTLSAHLSSPA